MTSKPNPLLLSSSILYFAAAVGLLFAPQELTASAGAEAGDAQTALLQVIGSALFGFAMLNWMNRFARTGGILGRPLVVANLAHAGSATLLLAKFASRPPLSLAWLAPALAYAVIALAFGIALFRPTPSSPG